MESKPRAVYQIDGHRGSSPGSARPSGGPSSEGPAALGRQRGSIQRHQLLSLLVLIPLHTSGPPSHEAGRVGQKAGSERKQVAGSHSRGAGESGLIQQDASQKLEDPTRYLASPQDMCQYSGGFDVFPPGEGGGGLGTRQGEGVKSGG